MGCSSTGSGYNRGIKGACAHERNNIRDFAKDLCSLVQPAGTNISLRIYYDTCELDGCKIYALSRVDEL